MKTLVIFDLEATCWEEGAKLSRTDSEIIEIGAVRLDKETGEIIDTFQKFVRPHFHPILSDFCKNLTSIKQEDVLNANEFETSLGQFNDWLGNNDEYIMSWGYYDKNQILKECNNKGIDSNKINELENKLLNKHLNMKNQFSHMFNIKHCGLSRALKYLKLKFDGTQHRGIDDAKNMAIIYKEIKKDFFKKIYEHD